jgi:hypothetical protein
VRGLIAGRNMADHAGLWSRLRRTPMRGFVSESAPSTSQANRRSTHIPFTSSATVPGPI